MPPEDTAAISSTEATLVASRALLGVIAASLTPALDEVSLPVFRLLVVLTADGAISPDQLGTRTAATDEVVRRTVAEAAEGGWVTVAPAGLVRIESRGRALVDEVTERRRALVSAILGSMATDDQRKLTEAFTAFADAAGESPMESILMLGL